MVLGTSSGAGKSWLATALCRHYANQGLKVAPFKAQNMSNNARVVAGADGVAGEIGSAQYFQALAARAVPDVRMNPLLLKPEADTHSQVVLLGQVDRELTALPWRGRSERVWLQIAAALDALRAENDVVVIEGAGSPAEINLMPATWSTCAWRAMPTPPACWRPTSTAAVPSPTCTAPGRCCPRPTGRASMASCSTGFAATPACWRRRPSSCRR
jgi:cobyric acid synthase